MPRSSMVLDRRITLQKDMPTGNKTAWNQEETTETEERVWAARRDMRTAEIEIGGETLASKTITRFYLRWRSDFSAKWRILDGGERFAIEGFRELPERRRFLEVTARKIGAS